MCTCVRFLPPVAGDGLWLPSVHRGTDPAGVHQNRLIQDGGELAAATAVAAAGGAAVAGLAHVTSVGCCKTAPFHTDPCSCASPRTAGHDRGMWASESELQAKHAAESELLSWWRCRCCCCCLQAVVKPPMAVTNAVSWRSEGIRWVAHDPVCKQPGECLCQPGACLSVMHAQYLQHGGASRVICQGSPASPHAVTR